MKERKKTRHRRLFYSIAIVSISLVISLTVYNMFFQGDREWTAVILDQLTIKEELVNPNFNSTCTSILASSGYTLQYYLGEDATVSFFRDLPAKSGKITLLRAHSAVRDNTDWVDLFTSEIFREGMYVDLARSKQISKAKMYSYNDDYFAIGPTFVNSTMEGQFEEGSVIVLMGCNSLNYTSMAKALVGRGAKVVIGWTNWVDAIYTDYFTLQLLNLLLAENPSTIRGSVNELNTLMENQPNSNPYRTRLAFYPTSDEVATYILPRKIRSETVAMQQARLLIQIVLCTTLVTNRYRDDQLNPNLVFES